MNILDTVIRSFQSVLTQLFEFVPRLVGFLVILLIGWIVGSALAKGVTFLLRKAGFDRILQAVAQWVGIEIHRAELVERVRQEVLEQSPHQRAEELVTIMAHDMRNYLTPLKGRLGRMELRARRERREQDVSDVTAASNTLNLLERVISDLLDVRRLNQGIFTVHPQSIYLVALVQEVVPAFSDPETPIHVHAPQEIVLWADPDRIRQVLENLLANAVKYAPKHTPITVQVDKEKRVDRPWVILRVSNAGPGLSSELRAQLVRPFVAGVTSKGLGLGLYLANKIAVAHNGTLTVDSPRGQGVLVTLALPLEDEETSEKQDTGEG